MAQAPRCGVRALTWWSLIRDEGDKELYYCGHCSDHYAEAMVKKGWTQVADERDAPVVVAS